MTNPNRRLLFPGTVIGELRLIMRVACATKGSYNTRKRWRVQCSCGKRLTVPQYYLQREKPKTHCGCKTATYVSQHKDVRGIWLMMRVRCYDSNHVGFSHYGGRGIRVADCWLNDPDGFKAFVEYMGPRPSPDHTLDRIDPDKWYEPGNVRWATWSEQNRNKRWHKQAAELKKVAEAAKREQEQLLAIDTQTTEAEG